MNYNFKKLNQAFVKDNGFMSEIKIEYTLFDDGSIVILCFVIHT